MECVFDDINLVFKLKLSFRPILSAFVRLLGDIFVLKLTFKYFAFGTPSAAQCLQSDKHIAQF